MILTAIEMQAKESQNTHAVPIPKQLGSVTNVQDASHTRSTLSNQVEQSKCSEIENNEHKNQNHYMEVMRRYRANTQVCYRSIVQDLKVHDFM